MEQPPKNLDKIEKNPPEKSLLEEMMEHPYYAKGVRDSEVIQEQLRREGRCPECGSGIGMVYQESCSHCTSCGYSAC